MRLTTHRLDMSDLGRSLEEPGFLGLLEKGYTLLSCHVVQEDGQKHDELLLIMRPPVDDPQMARVEAKLDEMLAKMPDSKPVDLRPVTALLAVVALTPWLLVALQAVGLL